MALKFKKWDVTERMDNEKYISEYLKAAFECGDISALGLQMSIIMPSKPIRKRVS
ncbi:MAG: hypothetical protein FWD40_08680 [Treponema sp.]|nr:hypothetical protein [Treponema sp.]